ncbi:MAG: hypothetical protein U0401_04625 [Anaerolineae bacterium]
MAECREAARLPTPDHTSPSDQPNFHLRYVSPAIFEAAGAEPARKSPTTSQPLFSEMQRVSEGIAAWRSGDLRRFGALVSESGESSVKNYECGSPQLITLYETLRETPGVLGARASEWGRFRGSCLALIDPSAH